MSFPLDQNIITGKDVCVWAVSGVTPTLTITAGVPMLTVSGGTAAPVSTLARIKLDNLAQKAPQMASNLGGGVRLAAGRPHVKGVYVGVWACAPSQTQRPLRLQLHLGRHCRPTRPQTPARSARPWRSWSSPDSEEERNKVYWIAYFQGAGFDFSAYAETGSSPNIDPLQDATQPQEYPTKSLGLGLGPVGSLYVAGGVTQMYWSGGSAGQVVPFINSMRLRIMALADEAWPSNVNGIAFTPRGTIDFMLKITECVKQWSTPSDTLIGDLDGTHSVLMATRLNSDLSFASGWGLEYGSLGAKVGEYDHGTKVLTTEYTFEKNILQTGGQTYLGSIIDPNGVARFRVLGT